MASIETNLCVTTCDNLNNVSICRRWQFRFNVCLLTHLWILPQRKSKIPFFLTVPFVFRNMWATKKKQKTKKFIWNFFIYDSKQAWKTLAIHGGSKFNIFLTEIWLFLVVIYVITSNSTKKLIRICTSNKSYRCFFQNEKKSLFLPFFSECPLQTSQRISF